MVKLLIGLACNILLWCVCVCVVEYTNAVCDVFIFCTISTGFLCTVCSFLYFVFYCHCIYDILVTDYINGAGDAIASVRLSVRPFVSTLSLELTDLTLSFCFSIGHDLSSQGIEG